MSDEQFEAHIAQRNVEAARVCCLLAAVLMPAFAVLDWLTHPEMVRPFLVLRLGTSLLSIGLLVLTFASWARRVSVVLGAAPALLCAAMIEVMVVRLEGYSSPYYAGLCLCIMGVGVIFTWTMRQTAIACGIIVAMWLAPALARPILVGPFSNNLFFLLAFSVIAVASNGARYAMARREFDARTELAHTTSELASTLDRLKELDRIKNEFFANISHELRTPLTLILAPIDELLDEAAPRDDRGRLQVVRRNAERLLRLIDDLLDLARLEAGGLRLNVAPVNLAGLVAQVVDAFRPAAEHKSLTLTLALPAPPETSDIHGDPHRLEMVLTNLIGNALKFTPEGGRIDLRVAHDRAGVTVEVADSGPGIPAADLARIFDRFYQVEGSARRRHGGAGIGLALAKELAELHGGQLSATSAPGSGTTFRLVLPAGRAHFRPDVIERRRALIDGHQGRRATDPRPDSAAPLPADFAEPASAPPVMAAADTPLLLDGARRPRVLVAEDQDDLRSFICDVLAHEFEVLAATDGLEAMGLARRERPDLVLSDVMMPGRSGTDLCQAIKKDPTLQATPVILLTARAGTDAALEGYASGADDFVAKPFHTRVLIARVRAQLKLRALSLQVAAQARLAAVGTLAAGILHEVRNPINAILNAAEVLINQSPGEDTARKLLLVIGDGARRIAAIAAALDEHAHPAEAGALSLCDVRAGIDATLALLEHRTAEVIVHRDYATARPALAPAGELNQVFLNILDNALRAPARNIWIRVAEHDGRVVVRIADDGPGVPPDLAPRIFDPFFTTRQPGQGTGLGLYLSRRIITQHGGDLRLERRAGGGAEFAIELPAELG